MTSRIELIALAELNAGSLADALVTVHNADAMRGLDVRVAYTWVRLDLPGARTEPEVLAESAASMGAFLNCAEGEVSVGTDLNISHLRSKRDGKIVATARPVRKGRTLHVWSIDIADENGKLVAVARCTIAIRKTGEQGAG